MHYLVKRASDAVELSNDWNNGQWKQANILELTNYMGDKPKYFPRTQAKLLYDEENVYVFFRVEDQYVRAIVKEIHGKVWQDSCVEFFFAPDTKRENRYFNLETNCGGTILFHFNDKANNIEKCIDISDCKSIEILHSLPKIIADEIAEPTLWTLSYKLPLDVIAKYCEMTKPNPGVKWEANFYKCADKTSYPHWLTWSVVDNPTPNFHLPQYFGVLEFE